MVGLFDGFEGHRVLAPADVKRAMTSALVAIDANVLLNLYRYNARTTSDLLAIFERFGDRLVVPHQAIREFHRNRLAAVGNPEGAVQDLRGALDKNQRSTGDALTRWAKQVALDDAELLRLQAIVGDAFDSVREAAGEADPDKVRVDTPAADDRVLSRLGGLLQGRVLPQPPADIWAALIAEGQERVEQQRPPGYLDADKADANPEEGAAGDFLVYRQACEEATRRGLDLVIITGDEKEDWWWRHRSVAIGPRPEMVKEFFDLSDGRQLFLLTPRGLLQLSEVLDVKVSPGSVEDAARSRGELDAPGAWTDGAVYELLRRLEAERQVQADVIRTAAELGGVVDRETVYAICGYDDSRMLKGFTRPTARITTDLQEEGLVAEHVTPMLVPLYPDDVRASGFRIPTEVVGILRSSTSSSRDDELRADSQDGGKYAPLTDWLLTQTTDTLPMAFTEIELVLRDELAPSARKHLAYWYSVRNALGKAIAAGGYKATRADLVNETVRLVRRVPLTDTH
ncbi:PIN-like domain-containing protein [Polymorphospora rubra]|uniref:PIN-like domain-containing protein n=1 Tax=Polymorphospora rubra TaxID=338584 RepID=UPI0034012939